MYVLEGEKTYICKWIGDAMKDITIEVVIKSIKNIPFQKAST